MASIRCPAMWRNGTANWYDANYYKNAPDRNPKGPERGTQKAFRGGGWMDSGLSIGPAQRNGAEPNTKMNWLGFRCARSSHGRADR